MNMSVRVKALKVSSIAVVLVGMGLAAYGANGFSKPGDSAHMWVAGTWTYTSRWQVELTLHVGDGNKIGGSFSNVHPDSGEPYYGTFKGEVSGNLAKFTLTMDESGNEYEYTMEKYSDNSIVGTREGRELYDLKKNN